MTLGLLIAYLLLFGFLLIFTYRIAPFIYKKWQEYQSERAAKAGSQFEDMFVFIDKKKLTLAFILSPIVLSFIVYLIVGNFIFAIVGFFVGIALPFIFIKNMAASRKRKFNRQLIDSLMIISNSLKAGLSMLQAVEVLVEEMPSPVRDEFSLVVREVRMGIPLEEAIEHLNERMPSEEMNLITSAVLIGKETGGDLTKVFARLIDTIRERSKLKELVMTLTLQGRLQGIIMSMIPVVFVMIVTRTNPNHFDIMLNDDFGRILLVAAVVLQVIALIMIKIFSVVKL